jgi:dimeric dUTPase (all-alpha-NTP-PPase superfamily)
LIVELAELANEVRSFKFWSYKPPSSKEIILEEYVDGLHFISSFAIIYQLPANFTLPDNIRVLDKAQITIKFNELLNLLSKLRFEHKLHCNKRIVKKWFRQYLILAYHLGFNFADVHRVYFEKNKVNFDRQANNY